MSVLGLIVACLFFAAGVAGTLLPALPGAPLILLGMIIYGLFTGFYNMSLWFFIFQGVAVGLIFLVDYAANAWGVRRYGGSKSAIWGSMAGLLLGVLLLGPLGIIIGPFLGAVAGELISQKPLDRAVKTGLGTLLGLAGGTVLKLVVEAGMIIWFFTVIW